MPLPLLFSMNSWVAPDGFTAQLDVAASISEQLAAAEEDAEASLRLAEGASILRHGGRVARTFKESAVRMLESGVRPSVDQATRLATR